MAASYYRSPQPTSSAQIGTLGQEYWLAGGRDLHTPYTEELVAPMTPGQPQATCRPAESIERSRDISAPSCKILLVEASSSSFSNLGAAVNEAANLGATEISNSYGGSKSLFETFYDSYYNRRGVAITASSGNSG